MSLIDDLIKQHCPTGVLHQPLGEVINVHFGERITKMSDAGGQVPVYGGGGISFMTSRHNREDEYVVSRFAMSANCVRKVSGKFWLLDSGLTFSVPRQDVLKDFVGYFLFNIQPKIYACTTQAAQRNLKTDDFKAITIPIPPIEVQRAIVDILDKFTNLEAELEAELDARRKQYEHYRNELLSFKKLEGGVRWISMGDVVRIRNGSDWKRLPEGDVPVYGSGGVMGFVGTAVHAGPSVLIPRKGSLGNLFFLDRPFWTVDTCFYTEMDIEQLNPKFLYYFLKTQELEKLNVAGGVPSLTQTMLNKVLIPLVSLEMQLKMVRMLDRFDDLTTSISAGLPAEIDARRKQYEYYRDKLLTFKELDVA